MPIIQHGHIDWGKSVKSLTVNGDLYTEVTEKCTVCQELAMTEVYKK